jgi:hypothetical protein
VKPPVYRAWKSLYDHPNWREVICIIIHDWGYWYAPNMDGLEGQRHPELGARIARRLLGDEYGDLVYTTAGITPGFSAGPPANSVVLTSCRSCTNRNGFIVPGKTVRRDPRIPAQREKLDWTGPFPQRMVTGCAVNSRSLPLRKEETPFRHCRYMMGLGHLGLGRTERVRERLDDVLRLDPNHQGTAVHRRMCETRPVGVGVTRK